MTVAKKRAPAKKKSSKKKSTAKKRATTHRAKKGKGVKVRTVAKGERVSMVAIIRDGILADWDDAKIIKVVAEKFPDRDRKRVQAGINWHRNPKHKDDLMKGRKTA